MTKNKHEDMYGSGYYGSMNSSQNSATDNKKVNKNRFFWKRVLLVFLLFLFIWLLWSSLRIFMTYLEARRNRIFAEQQKIEFTQGIDELNKKIEQVKTTEGVEEHIRTKYPFVKDGERVLVINKSEIENLQKPKTLWQKIKAFWK